MGRPKSWDALRALAESPDVTLSLSALWAPVCIDPHAAAAYLTPLFVKRDDWAMSHVDGILKEAIAPVADVLADLLPTLAPQCVPRHAHRMGHPPRRRRPDLPRRHPHAARARRPPRAGRARRRGGAGAAGPHPRRPAAARLLHARHDRRGGRRRTAQDEPDAAGDPADRLRVRAAAARAPQSSRHPRLPRPDAVVVKDKQNGPCAPLDTKDLPMLLYYSL